MANTDRLAHSSLPHFHDRAMGLFTRLRRPVYHGELAVEAGCSLDQVTRELASWLESGRCRVVTPDELLALGLEPRALAYRLA